MDVTETELSEAVHVLSKMCELLRGCSHRAASETHQACFLAQSYLAAVAMACKSEQDFQSALIAALDQRQSQP